MFEQPLQTTTIRNVCRLVRRIFTLISRLKESPRAPLNKINHKEAILWDGVGGGGVERGGLNLCERVGPHKLRAPNLPY